MGIVPLASAADSYKHRGGHCQQDLEAFPQSVGLWAEHLFPALSVSKYIHYSLLLYSRGEIAIFVISMDTLNKF